MIRAAWSVLCTVIFGACALAVPGVASLAVPLFVAALLAPECLRWVVRKRDTSHPFVRRLA